MLMFVIVHAALRIKLLLLLYAHKSVLSPYESGKQLCIHMCIHINLYPVPPLLKPDRRPCIHQTKEPVYSRTLLRISLINDPGYLCTHAHTHTRTHAHTHTHTTTGLIS